MKCRDFGLVYVVTVMAVVEQASGILSPAGENVCLFDEKYIDTIQIRELVPVKVYKIQWCWRIPPRCKVETTTLKPTLVTKEIPRTRIVPRCCHGYYEIVAEGRCVPRCSEPCVYGDCTEPETCSCESGYRGERCNEICLPGTWGRGCVEKCDCRNNATCGGVHGNCNCSPGWMGLRCDAPCDPGYYGTNCEFRCDCDGELCDHVTGECEATTVSSSTEEATTTETAVPTQYVTYASETTTVATTEEDQSTSVQTTTGEWTTDAETISGIDIVATDANATTTEPETETAVVVRMYESNYGNETVEENEIESSKDFSSVSVQRKKFNLFSLIQNLSIVCGVFVLIFVVTMCSVMISHYRKMRKMAYTCKKGSSINSQDIAIHRFYGGTSFPVKSIAENSVYTTDLDLEIQQPTLMTFKPLPEDKKPGKEYFLKSNDSAQEQFDYSQRFRTLDEDYYQELGHFDYDIKPTTFSPSSLNNG